MYCVRVRRNCYGRSNYIESVSPSAPFGGLRLMKQHDIFDSLARNAFDFLERGIEEFDKSPKYSVIHFPAASG